MYYLQVSIPGEVPDRVNASEKHPPAGLVSASDYTKLYLCMLSSKKALWDLP
jgi:hypothetical protein